MRPRSPLEVQELQSLQRVASLGAAILVTLRRPGRGVAESERELRTWLQADGVAFGNDDLVPALSMLAASKRIGWSPAKKNTPRRVWLAGAATEPSEDASEIGVVADGDNSVEGHAPTVRPAPSTGDIESIAVTLARRIHYEGACSRVQVERMLAGASRRISLDQVLAYAEDQGWLVVFGQRVIPEGEAPELETSARFVPVGDGVGTY